jgi:hypothetical protein
MCFDSTTVELHQALGQCEPDCDSLLPSIKQSARFHAVAELVTA